MFVVHVLRKFPSGHQLPTWIFFFLFCLTIFLKFFCSTRFAAAFFDNISRIWTPLSSSEREEIVGFVFCLNKQITTRIYREKERAVITTFAHEHFSRQKVHRDTRAMLTAPFNNMRTLKFKAQQTNAFFAAINEMFGASSQLPTFMLSELPVLDDLIWLSRVRQQSEAGRSCQTFHWR